MSNVKKYISIVTESMVIVGISMVIVTEPMSIGMRSMGIVTKSISAGDQTLQRCGKKL
jgi:hypothetical protein